MMAIDDFFDSCSPSQATPVSPVQPRLQRHTDLLYWLSVLGLILKISFSKVQNYHISFIEDGTLSLTIAVRIDSNQ